MQEKLIVLLDHTAQEASFFISSYGFSSPAADNVTVLDTTVNGLQYYLKQLVDSYYLKYGTVEQREEVFNRLQPPPPPPDNHTELEKVSVTLSFSATYNQLIDYLKLLEDLEKVVIVNNISISSENNSLLSGSMTLDFYVLPKLFPNEADAEETKWNYDLPKGKASPFGEPIVSAVTALTQEPAAAQPGISPMSFNSPDFFMMAKSITSGMPTMTIGKANDSSAETYLESTLDGVENVTLNLTARGGKFYYSYKTGTKAYPANGESEFVPNRENAIHFVVYTSPRSSNNDKNVINVTVANNTGLTFNYAVDNDDKARPRVKVTVL